MHIVFIANSKLPSDLVRCCIQCSTIAVSPPRDAAGSLVFSQPSITTCNLWDGSVCVWLCVRKVVWRFAQVHVWITYDYKWNTLVIRCDLWSDSGWTCKFYIKLGVVNKMRKKYGRGVFKLHFYSLLYVCLQEFNVKITLLRIVV